MAQTAASKAKQAEREKIRAQLEKEVRAQLEAEYADKLEAAEANAQTASAQAAPPKINESDPSTPEVRTVHFVDDGLTLLGKVWMRGETLTIGPDSPDWTDLLTATGNTLDMTETQQVARWGRRHFAPGPWPYDTTYEIDPEAYKVTKDGITTFDSKAFERDKATLASIQQRKNAAGS